MVSSTVFQVIFNHVVYNTALLLAFCCCSFLLHVIANLICIILISDQLVLLSSLPKFLHSFYGKKVRIPLFFKKMSSRLMLIIFYPFVCDSKFHFYTEEMGWPVHYVLLFLKISGPKLV